MKAMVHPKVVRFSQMIERTSNICLFMQHVGGGQLLPHIPEAMGLQKEEACRVFRQIVSARHYCHQKGDVHRDLKSSENFHEEAMERLRRTSSRHRHGGKKMKVIYL